MLKKGYLLWAKPLPEDKVLQLHNCEKEMVFKSLLDLFRSVFEVDPSRQYVYRVLYSYGDDGTSVYIRRRVSPRNLLLAFYHDGWKTNTGVFVKNGEGFTNPQALLEFKAGAATHPGLYLGGTGDYYDSYNTIMALSNKHILLLRKYLEDHDWHLARALLAYSRNKEKVQATTSSSDKGRLLSPDVSLTEFRKSIVVYDAAEDCNALLQNYSEFDIAEAITAFSDELFPYRNGSTIAISNKAYSKAKSMLSKDVMAYIDSVLVEDMWEEA